MRNARDLTQKQLGEMVGLTQQAIQMIEDGSVKQPRKIEKIAKALKVEVQWLLFGEKENEVLVNEQIPLVLFKNISLFLKGNMDKLCHQKVFINLAGKASMKSFAITIQDDSMISIDGFRSFNKGETVVIDPERPVSHGDLVLALVDDTPVFSKYFSDESIQLLVFSNPEYSPIRINDQIEICGVAIMKYSFETLV